MKRDFTSEDQAGTYDIKKDMALEGRSTAHWIGQDPVNTDRHVQKSRCCTFLEQIRKPRDVAGSEAVFDRITIPIWEVTNMPYRNQQSHVDWRKKKQQKIRLRLTVFIYPVFKNCRKSMINGTWIKVL